MIRPPHLKYQPFAPLKLPARQWPDRVLTTAPHWCSVDLRDGNQALAIPMSVAQKLEMFDMLVAVGFKEIEVGFPSASNTEFEFLRTLIEKKRIPDDVTIQVLVQAREELIDRTVESLVGARRAVIHLYNSTSPAQREYVFGLSKPAIIEMAVRGTRWIKDRLPRLQGTEVVFQYSPESFSATETEFALEICEAVMEVWQPTADQRMILNLPDTVEVAMPNVYADQIEWFIAHLRGRDRAIISVHTHNDRGTGVAATELALLAGAERVEGTLFGNGERTGNLDIVTVALNLYMHGIDPGLDFSDLNSIRSVYERTTGMSVPPRQPYIGELVFTAFSGSHQDAIKKGLAAWKSKPGQPIWDVPYLTIDPEDIGREYREIIRVNAQSGKGGIAYLLEHECGLILPRELQKEFAALVNVKIDQSGREAKAAELRNYFWEEYVELPAPMLQLASFQATRHNGITTARSGLQQRTGQILELTGSGNGPIDAFVESIRIATQAGRLTAPDFQIHHFSEHSLGTGASSSAISYIAIQRSDLQIFFGAAEDTSIELASIKAVVCALNRALKSARLE